MVSVWILKRWVPGGLRREVSPTPANVCITEADACPLEWIVLSCCTICQTLYLPLVTRGVDLTIYGYCD